MLLLPVLGLLSGCGGMPAVTVQASELCKSWRHQTISRHDVLTDGTAAGIEGSNGARLAWGCAYGKNKAK
jgi:hypothetical protein